MKRYRIWGKCKIKLTKCITEVTFVTEITYIAT